MSVAQTNVPSPITLTVFSVTSAIVVLAATLRGYSFIPNRGADGFLNQIEYVQKLLEFNSIEPFLENPLNILHALRYLVIYPFLILENILGPPGSMALLQLLLWPLLIVFRPQRWDWREGARLIILTLPLAVSGRTVLVVAGMGYLVSGAMKRPFSGWHLFIGCLLAALSSASLMLSVAVLAVAGNWRDRSRAYYVAKAFYLLMLVSLFLPALVAKAEGFSSGAPGYAYEEDLQGDEDSLGSGPLAAMQRIILRSTVVESYRHENYPRVVLYLALFAAAWINICWSAATRNPHPLLVVLAILSSGILLEGLALWPVLLPIIWAYTGVVETQRPPQQPA